MLLLIHPRSWECCAYRVPTWTSTVLITIVSLTAMGPAAMAAFPSGVACGDVTDSRAILWARADQAGPVRAQVATDQLFTRVVRQVDALATADTDLTVKVVLEGLVPGARYYYRFYVPGDPPVFSGAGTFRTAPSPDEVAPFRFVFTGDADFSRGPFHVLTDAAAQQPDLFVFSGDTVNADIPAGGLGIARTLDEYRARYVQNRTDTGMREIMSRTPLLVGWDDHEVADNYYGAGPGPDPRVTPTRMAAGHQAFFEYMPIRTAGDPQDPFRTYRSIRYGALAEFFLLDGRQYREPPADQACDNDPDPFDLIFGGRSPNEACLTALSEPRTYLGADQLAWIKAQLAASTARYKFVVTDQTTSFLGILPYDRWDGYDAERRELLEHIDANRIEGVWFMATDVHMNVFNPDVGSYFRQSRPDYQLENGVAVHEIVTGPIASITLRNGALGMAADVLGPASDLPIGENLLNVTFNGMMLNVARANDWAFWHADRYAYATVDVTADGVNVFFRGYDPALQSEQTPPIYTLYDSETPDNLPCWVVPGSVALLLVLLTTSASRSRRMR